MRKLSILLSIFVFILGSCSQPKTSDPFVKRQGHQLTVNDDPYYFVGTNYWYGAILASTGQGGDRARLIKELDMMKQHGITNLRILAGAEGPNNEPYRVTPALQLSPGIYNDTLLDGLDFLMVELGKRKMYAVLFLNNSWEWSGGFSQYLNWSGYGDIPYPQIAPHTWPEFMSFSGQFINCEPCQEKFQNHIRFLLSRTNQYNGKKYVDDPAIMTWEIANEPRAFSDANKSRFAEWIRETAAFIKSIDPNHLVTTGSEGQWGCEGDMELFRKIHDDPNIDYLTMHTWPKNWNWLDSDHIAETVDTSIVLTKKYMTDHIEVARQLNKPIVLEEFGLPRDHHTFGPDDTTTARDKYYGAAFKLVEKSEQNGDVLAGSNFWAFAGLGRHSGDDPYWKLGDDLMGDPPQEPQGLNSVYDIDSTMDLIKEHANKLGN
ncbi:glycoside hydrolase 5 family protein [Sunxiuqinia indica]|uniref:glycoside hydrolase 5 family protein n=1 Tax=Sunxiuqinia indica TaxID=2692584 RepID=UPI00135C3F39|nr:cellulase family glycosylhydrolase [Sunxiuqinia indica]